MASCRSYEARPLDLDAHRERWLARSASDEGVALLASASEGPFDASDGLTADEAEIVALVYSPALRLARLRAGVALATAEHAGLWDDPSLGVDVERILEGGSHPWIVAGTIGLTLPISGRLEAEKERAGAAGEAALRRVEALEWSIRHDVRRAWVEWTTAQQIESLTRETHEQLDGLTSIVDRFEEAGEYSRVEARVFRMERIGVAADMDAAATRARDARLRLLALMGLAPQSEVTLTPGFPVAGESMDDASRRAAMERSHPELASLRAAYEEAEATLRREIREQFPDITIGPGGKEEDGDTRVLFGVSLPLALWNRNQQGVAVAEAQRELARAEFETTYERLVGELASAESRLLGARELRERLERELAPVVEAQDEDMRRLVELRRMEPLLLLDATTRRRNAKQRLMNAYADEAMASIALAELTGPRTMETTR